MQLLLAFVAASVVGGAVPRNGEELIREMRQRYDGKWYTTLTFVQKTTQPNSSVETWYEALQFPGKLRIDIAPLDSGRAILFRNDSIWQFNGGRAQAGRPFVHPLMVLGFDVYFDPAEKTIGKLKALSFDLSKLRSGTWQGRAVYIVGSDSAGSKSPEFWIDQENLLFVRMLQPRPNGTVAETQFNKYVKLGNAWISPEVLFFVDGKPGVIEEYSDWKIGMTFDEVLFDPARFTRAGWIKL